KTPLMAAVGKGDLTQVKRLVAKGKDPSQISPEGMTALMEAAEAGHLAIVRYLVEKGADLNAAHRSTPGSGGGYGGRTALEKATARKRIAIAEYLMEKGAAITPFALIRMIEQRGDLSAMALNRLDDPQTAQSVLTGVLRMGKWNVAERLLKLGADARKRDLSGNTPTHWAAGWGKIAAMRFLLRHGADINAVNRFGKTPLDNAAGLHRLKMIEFLLAHGADVRTGAPLASALQSLAGRARAAQAIPVVRTLLRRGADVNRPDPRFDETPLMQAARAGSLELVRLLVGSGADVNRRSRSNRTALLISRMYKRPRVEAYLLKQAARKPAGKPKRWRGPVPPL
ncbi:MAG: ankyrin repeat domain-containing protein, partial [bacterium]